MSGINSIYDSYSNAPVNTAKSNSKVKETKATDKSASSAENAAKTAEQASSKRTDTFERSEGTAVKNNTYTKGIKTEHTGMSEKAIRNEGMKDVIKAMLDKQAGGGTGKIIDIDLKSVMKSYGLDYIESDGSEDFWGAEKTANRILDFAKSLAGNDPKNFETVKNAFVKGFGECKKIWGGELPDVCGDTYDRVMQGFDDWEKELNSAADEAAASAQ